MNSLLKTKILRSVHIVLTRSMSSPCSYRENFSSTPQPETLSSKEIRKLFLNYFIQEKDHTFVHSSPVFLNNDPSLLFVNAGMNQFRSLLLNKTYPEHPFHHLKRAANSQKCVRLSGKHNDLKDVGVDLYHHTFFEMLGSWSFGDYTKFDACKMAWELLTNVYGLNAENLYVTYFGGDQSLGILPDKECKDNWLKIGVHPNHIFPFGAKDNFWEMGDTGPCGPCTEIHYNFNSAGHEFVAQRINAGSPDVMEIWNLVFIQFKREKDGILKSIPVLNIDTGMGFERLCAVLQGTRSNYDTDIFIPLFQAIQSNFKLRPYTGKTGAADVDGLDTAYRIIADHSRMFSVAIADGLFPDSCDAGHVLRKIIRRAAYTANRDMKTRPGALSSLVPYVAETLDFFPEINKHINEIISIVDEEEKMFHQVINKGRKARNKMISDSSGNILDGHKVWELHKVHGLENNVVQDLASEVNLTVDWEDYETVKNEKLKNVNKQHNEETSVISTAAKMLKELSVPFTNDSVKYRYSTYKNNYGVENISAKILAVFNNTELVTTAEKGDNCILITDKSNFYSEGGGQISGIGRIYDKEFNFKVKHVSTSEGYVYHQGVVDEGRIQLHSDVQMTVEKDHHLACSQNHTATHILNAALRKVLPYTAQRSSYVSPTYLRFAFSAKSTLSLDQVEEIENYVNHVIQKKMEVSRKEMMFEELLNHPNVILLRGEDYPDTVSVISIQDESNSEMVSMEPCCGTHVHNTEDIGKFCIVPSKSSVGSTKFISAVTGIQAFKVIENGKMVQEKIKCLEDRVIEAIKDIKVSTDLINLLLKEVKATLRECQSKTDAPLLDLKKCEVILKELKLKLTDFINATSECDIISNYTVVNPDQTVSSEVINYLKENILPTNDAFKYDYCNKEVKPIKANVLAIFKDYAVVDQVERGLRCQLILDKTNFYSSDDDQACDIGIVSCDDFVVKIDSVHKADAYVFHEGFVEQGNAALKQNVNLLVNQEHRLACSQNHTALHILNAVMKKELPYFFPVSSNAGNNELQLNFTAKGRITDDQLETIEKDVNECIRAHLNVIKAESSIESIKEFPLYKAALIKKSKEYVPVVTINGNQNSNLPKSVEPCHGTHVGFTSDIGSFIIISQKIVKDKERVIRAVTGEKAAVVKKEGEVYDKKLLQLEQYVLKQLECSDLNHLQLWDCLKEVKEAKGYHETELPLLLFRSHQNTLSALTKRLTEATHDFVQKGFAEVKAEMQNVLKDSSEKKFIVHNLESLGDGKKIANYAIENSATKPALYFVKDGRNSYICSCSVPKSCVHSKFSALLWINPVASFLDGRARTLVKDPELLYSVVTNRIDKIEEATRIATEYALNHID